jgi:hypothetical protein
MSDRTPQRPHPGEMKACPKCASMMKFEERFSIVSGVVTTDPAWVCQNPQCAHIERVRL